jgi:CheY-like chemotaxis protein
MVHHLLFHRYDVTLGEDRRAALDLLQHQTFELALVDLSMPNIGGFHLATIIAASFPTRSARQGTAPVERATMHRPAGEAGYRCAPAQAEARP